MKTQFYCSIISIILLMGCIRESRRIENQIIFSKVYGYVKYFHPSDESAELDWKSFAIYGAAQMDKCRSTNDVIQVLEKLFEPIAPTIKFSTNISDFDSTLTKPASTEGFRYTFWQHRGVGIGMNNEKSIYESKRINRNNGEVNAQLFDDCPDVNEYTIKQIGKGIYCQIPIALYCNGAYTFPQANQNNLASLKGKIESIKDSKDFDLHTGLGNVVNVYNVFQHFYPYFDVVDVNWEAELRNALKQSYTDETNLDHLITLQKFTASLKDGHIKVYNNSIRSNYAPPIVWEWLENKLVITYVEQENDSIKVGDIVTHINGKNSAQYFEEVYSRISAATTGYLNHRANKESLLGEFCSYITIEIEGKEYQLKRTVNQYDWLQSIDNKPTHNEIGTGVWYLNLDKIEMDTINMLLPKLSESKSIICDLRGYPNKNGGFITNLMAIEDTTSAWMQVPQIIYPDQDSIIQYKKGNWLGYVVPRNPYLGDKKVIFIIDGSAISYAESIMGYIEGYNLATIIGHPTAGTNGNVNWFSLPGGYNISWTGMKVIKHDGSQLHGVGILPDINLEKTIQGLKDGRDEFLEKALELAKK